MTLDVDRICSIDRQDAWYKSLGRVVRELKERKRACTGCQSGSGSASLAADQLQTRQTLLPGYFFQQPGYLADLIDQPIQSVSLAAIIHTEASVSSAAQLGYCCSSFLCCCSETLELSSTELSNCSIR